MKNLIILVGIILVSCNFLKAQSLINGGAKIVNEAPSAIVFGGNYINEDIGDIVNEGTIVFKADLTNNAATANFMYGSTGLVKFNGAAPQHIFGSSTVNFYDIWVESPLQVHTYVSVWNNLTLSNYNVSLNDVLFQMQSGSSITGANSLAHIKTLGWSKLLQIVGVSDKEFPVGTMSSYAPLTIRNDDFYGVGYIGVNVFPDVLEQGTSGATISDIDHCVNLTWDIDEQIIGDLDLVMTVNWNSSDEGSLFDRTRAGIGHCEPGFSWVAQMESPAIGSDPYSLTRSGLTSVGAFAVGDSCSPMANTFILNMDIKAFLEGPFNGTDMNTNLTGSTNLTNFPLSQPFNVPPWNYAGTEGVTSLPNGDIVDWVLVELRDATEASQAYSSTIVDRQAAFLLKDGSIIGMDGISNLAFSNSISEKLFVVIWHRNHLGIISGNPVNGNCGVYSYNFTTGVDMVYGGADGHKELLAGSNKWGMIGGDGNADGVVSSEDKTWVWEPQAGMEGYLGGDFNLDGQVNNPDKNDIWYKNIGSEAKVPAEIPFPCGEQISDIDGNIYNTLQIGTQCWMKENLKTTKDADGNAITRYCYNNDPSNCNVYGGLYTWTTAMNGAASSNNVPSGVRGICPDGWHLPSDAEWTALTNYVSSQSGYLCDANTSYIAKALAAQTNWQTNSNTCAVGNNLTLNNATGFSGLPGGYFAYGIFYRVGDQGDLWLSTEFSPDYAWFSVLFFEYPEVPRSFNTKGMGTSVRCLRD
ncbi:MAG: hypothetical protein IH598_16775 [Bacteroidales bacterium]|nr:hypothetical protein [Bacteroidales bacterium]